MTAKKAALKTTKTPAPAKKAVTTKRTATKTTGRKRSASATKATKDHQSTPKPPARKATKKKSPQKKVTKKRTPKISEETVRGSKAFKDATTKAESYAKDPKKLQGLFEEAQEKAKSVPRGPFAELWAYFMAMLRLIRSYYQGEYRDIPWQSLVLIIVAVVYFVSPIDLIPDFLPVVGYIDDAYVISLVLRSVKDDLDAYMEWEASQS